MSDLPDTPSSAPARTSTPDSGGAIARVTRWVLAHKRVVVIFWVLVTLVGMALGRLGDESAQTEILGPRQGRLGHQPADRAASSTGPAATPRRCCPWSRCRRAHGRLARRRGRTAPPSKRACAWRCPARAWPATRAPPAPRSSRTTAARRSSSPTRRPDREPVVRQQPRKRPNTRRAALRGATRRRRAGARHRL